MKKKLQFPSKIFVILCSVLASLLAKSQTSLSHLGTYDSDKSLYDIAVKGDNAYLVGNVAGLADGLEIIDVSNPSSPVYTGSTGVTYADENALSVEVNPNSDVVYMGTDKKFYNIDVSTPSSPSNLFSATVNGETWGLFYDNNYLYGTRYNFGVARTNVSNPSSPSSSGGYTTGGNDACQNVFVKGNYVYVARRSTSGSNKNTLWIVNQTNFQLVGNYNSNPFEPIWDVFVSGNYAYLANGKNGVTIVDVSNPASPVEVTKIQQTSSNSGAYSVDINGNYLFIADGDKGLIVYDISNPSAPSLVDSDDTKGGFFKVKFVDNKVYCIGATASNEKKMLIYDFEVVSGIKDNFKNADDISLAPNPTNGAIVINLKKEYSSVEIKITNILGEVISNQKHSNIKTVQQELKGASGIYFVTVSSGNTARTFKVVLH